jgi:glycosyltransferase involved in cell wall biosynthesis
MKVLVFEPAKGGHHLVFLRYIVEDLLAGGYEVGLAAERGTGPSNELQRALGPSLPRCHWIRLSNGSGRFIHGRKLDALARAQKTWNAEVVFACCIDEFSSDLFRRTALGVPPPAALAGRMTGIFVRPRVADRREASTGLVKRVGFRRLCEKRWFSRLYVLDESLCEHLHDGLDPRRFVELPDPGSGEFVVSKAEARQKLGLPPDKFLYLHYGTSSRRKGLETLVAATEQISPKENCALLAAGRFVDGSSTEKSRLDVLAQQGRAYLFDRYIEDSEEQLFFRAADVVVLAYRGHYGSSNVQSRAAAAGRPIVASDEGLVGYRTREQHLGLTFPSGDAAGLAAALLKARGIPAAELARGLAAYAQKHSRQSFRDALLAGLG